MGAACTQAKKGNTGRKAAPKVDHKDSPEKDSTAHQQHQHETKANPIATSDTPREDLATSNHQGKMLGQSETGGAEIQEPLLWQGSNSGLPVPKKHTDNVTISQLKPWMRVTIPVKVISLGVPTKVNRNQIQSRQASKGRQKSQVKETQHEMEAIAVVGDSTGCINMVVVDQQIPLFRTKQGSESTCLYLLNVHCRLLRSKQLRLEADQWSKIKPIDLATLIASTAQVDHLQADKAQAKLTNLLQVDTSNDMSKPVMATNTSQQQPQINVGNDQGQIQDARESYGAGQGGRRRNRSRSNRKGSNQPQSQAPDAQITTNAQQSSQNRSRSKRRRNNNRNRRSQSNQQMPDGGAATGNQKNQAAAQLAQLSINVVKQNVTQQAPSTAPKKQTTIGVMPDGPPLVIIDAQNIAMRYGHSQKFACLGIKIAIDFWQSRGHRVLGFLPDYLLWREKVLEKWELLAQAQRDPSSVDQATLSQILSKIQQLPDDVDYLIDLQQQGILCGTPSQDYDDSYCISYARQQCHKGKEAFIISNDLFRDYMANFTKRKSQTVTDKAQLNQLINTEKRWLKQHVVSYTFILDEFQPNPDSDLFELMQNGAFSKRPQVDSIAIPIGAGQEQINPEEATTFVNVEAKQIGSELEKTQQPYIPEDKLQAQTAQNQSQGEEEKGQSFESQDQDGQLRDGSENDEEQYYDEEDEDEIKSPQQVEQPELQANDQAPIPQLVFKQEFAPLGAPQQPVMAHGLVELREENLSAQGEREATGQLPYGYYRQQQRNAKQQQA